MKNILTLMLLLFSFGVVCQAQPNKENRDKIKEWRTAFITNKLDLTEAEAQKFWPIYNAREVELRAIKKDRRAHGLKDANNLSEEEAEVLINKHFESRQKELDLNKAYFQRLKSAIPASKIILIPRVETEFKRTILEKMRGSGQKPRGQGNR